MAQDIFHRYAPKYFDLGYRPFCTQGATKIPLTKGRSFETYKLKHELNSAPSDSNIGIGVGKEFKVIALDIDTPDEFHGTEIEKQIEAILPTSKYCRVGRPGRKLYFFKYKDEENYASVNHNGKKWIELLTKNRFVVVPPSIHPDTKGAYYWTDSNLLDCPIDDLDYSPVDLYEALEKVQDLLENKIKADKSFKISSGRNDEMKKVVTAKLHEKKEFSLIIKESIEYDTQHHSPPLFSDASEFKGETDAEINALFFITNIYKSMGKNKPKLNIVEEKVQFEIVDNPENKTIEIDYKKEKLPKFRGIAQEMFEYIYKTSPVPRTRFAVASTIATMGTILSNRVKCSNIHPNFYVLITALSASGKDVPLKFPYNLFKEADCKDLVGGSPESDSGILYGLETQTTRLDIFDEASKLFYMMGDTKNLYAAKMADQYATLYTSSGKFFSGKTLKGGKTGECFSPCISLLCALTVSDFQKSFNLDLLSKGIGGRFLFFPDIEYRDIQESSLDPIPSSLVDYCYNMRNTINKNRVKFDNDNHSIDLTIKKEVRKAHLDIGNKYRRMGHNENPLLEPIYNRAIETIMKMAILDSMSLQEAPEVKMDNLEWAIKWFDSYMASLLVFLGHNLFSSKQQMIEQSLIDYVLSKGKNGVSRSDILRSSVSQKNCLRSKELEIYLLDAIEKELIFKKNKSDVTSTTKKAEIYIHVNYVKPI